ncbi:hypothetical protein MSG28_014802 [Choristoneura fumiferana]|uniref:Uncharacterized protein n=1 Tax=Choristoneura fumiferana TaxID=7141 RepID=A0ACC0JSY6_CHOFU|nr:hypothetical protein MSG28_014802 [Choristoneura fumiferana]
MEPSDCRRASDAQSTRLFIVTAKCEPVTVKEEPEWGECGVSEAAAAEGLYAGHQVKDELIIAPERMQQQDSSLSMQDVLNIKEENQHEAKTSEADAAPTPAVAGGLYTKNNVKYKLVVEPELMQKQDIAFQMPDVLNIEYEIKHEPEAAAGAITASECTHTWLKDGPCCIRCTEQQHRLKSSFVRLERLPAGNQDITTPFYMSRDSELNHSLTPSKLQLEHSGIENSGTREVTGSCQPPSDKQASSQSNLPNNVQANTHDKPHACGMGNSPYGCDICHQQFTQQSHLNAHLRIHTGISGARGSGTQEGEVGGRAAAEGFSLKDRRVGRASDREKRTDARTHAQEVGRGVGSGVPLCEGGGCAGGWRARRCSELDGDRVVEMVSRPQFTGDPVGGSPPTECLASFGANEQEALDDSVVRVSSEEPRSGFHALGR